MCYNRNNGFGKKNINNNKSKTYVGRIIRSGWVVQRGTDIVLAVVARRRFCGHWHRYRDLNVMMVMLDLGTRKKKSLSYYGDGHRTSGDHAKSRLRASLETIQLNYMYKTIVIRINTIFFIIVIVRRPESSRQSNFDIDNYYNN